MTRARRAAVAGGYERLSHWRHLPSWLGVVVLWLIHWLPFPLQALLGNALGTLLPWFSRARRCVVLRNLELCFPEIGSAQRARWMRATFRATARATLEHGVLWWASDARLRRLVHIENPEAALGDGVRPVVWLAPHFVGLDMGGTRLTMDYHFASLYAEVANLVFNHCIRHGRSRFHPTVLFAKSEGVKPLLRKLRDGMPAYYLPDQDFGRRHAVFASFFGVPAATLSALPRLARIADAQIVPVVTRQRPWGLGYSLRFYPPWDDFPGVDQTADITRMNRFIEDRVRETPAEYLWVHRRFKTRPEGEASLYG